MKIHLEPVIKIILTLSFSVTLITCDMANQKGGSMDTIEHPPQLPIHFKKSDKPVVKKGWHLISFPIVKTSQLSKLIQSAGQYFDVEAVWKWDTSLESQGNWRVYPKTGSYPLLTEVVPEEGYWVKSKKTLKIIGTGISSDSYRFKKGWNLIGYGHYDSPIFLSEFFKQGHFWKNNCSRDSPVLSAWAWQNHQWLAYFPNDRDRIRFNTTHRTQIKPFHTLEPGMGVWVHASYSNSFNQSLECEDYQDRIASPEWYKNEKFLGKFQSSLYPNHSIY